MPEKHPNRFAAFVNSPRVTGWFLVLVSLACGVGAIYTYDMASALRDDGQRVVGDVIEVHDWYRDSYVVVRFRDLDGNDVTTEVYEYARQPEPRVGDRPELVFDPADPYGNVVDTRVGPDFFTTWALAGGCLLAAVLVRPTWTGRLDWLKLQRWM